MKISLIKALSFFLLVFQMLSSFTVNKIFYSNWQPGDQGLYLELVYLKCNMLTVNFTAFGTER